MSILTPAPVRTIARRLVVLSMAGLAVLAAAACSSSSSSPSAPVIVCQNDGPGQGCTCTMKGVPTSPVSDCSQKAFPGTACCAYQDWPATTYADTTFCQCAPTFADGGVCPDKLVASCSQGGS